MSQEDLTLRVFTEKELRGYNGEGESILVAYKGIVYDVSNSPRWRTGMHENMHFPGLDLTGEMTEAPHNESVFQRPCVKIVGRMAG